MKSVSSKGICFFCFRSLLFSFFDFESIYFQLDFYANSDNQSSNNNPLILDFLLSEILRLRRSVAHLRDFREENSSAKQGCFLYTERTSALNALEQTRGRLNSQLKLANARRFIPFLHFTSLLPSNQPYERVNKRQWSGRRTSRGWAWHEDTDCLIWLSRARGELKPLKALYESWVRGNVTGKNGHRWAPCVSSTSGQSSSTLPPVAPLVF